MKQISDLIGFIGLISIIVHVFLIKARVKYVATPFLDQISEMFLFIGCFLLIIAFILKAVILRQNIDKNN